MSNDAGIDGGTGRVVAALVILVCAAALMMINRDSLFGEKKDEIADLNPDLAACLAERVGAVDAMKSDGVVNEAQYDLFRSRAVAYCESEFGEPANPPPGSGLSTQ